MRETKYLHFPLRHIFAVYFILAVCLFPAAAHPVFAAEMDDEDEYRYNVTFFAGNRGVFSNEAASCVSHPAGTEVTVSETQIQVSGLRYGDRISFQPSKLSVHVEDENMYYIRGVRRSGRDNNTVANSDFTVSGDEEYVVAYGIKGNMVAYTVNYQDEDGNALAAREIHYGNIGDKPVVAYLYVENYQPQAYNLTKTLEQNEAANEFTFVYRPIAAGQTTAGQTTGDAGNNTTGTATGDNNTAVSGADQNIAEGTAEGTEDTGLPGEAAEEGNTAEGGEVGNTEPEELVDLDEEEVPLARGMENNSARKKSKAPLIVAGVIAAAAAAVLIVLVLALAKKRRKKQGSYDR